MIEFAERASGIKMLEDRQILEMMIQRKTGEITLNLTDEQYAKVELGAVADGPSVSPICNSQTSIPIPRTTEGVRLISIAELFETSVLSFGVSLVMSFVKSVASWLARDMAT